jgi:flagellar biosynthesis/type III secretory pathway protein FliH
LLDYDKLSDEEKRAYDRALESRRGERDAFYTAKIEGRAEGHAEGMAEGLRNVVLNAHKARISLPDICALTGLSEDKIREIIYNN